MDKSATETTLRELVQEVESAILKNGDISKSLLYATACLHRIALTGPPQAGYSISIKASLHFLGETATVKLEERHSKQSVSLLSH